MADGSYEFFHKHTRGDLVHEHAGRGGWNNAEEEGWLDMDGVLHQQKDDADDPEWADIPHKVRVQIPDFETIPFWYPPDE